jgi:hypothetical protein
METNSSNYYHAFNARYLTLEQVVESFITNEDFEKLIEPNNTVLIGPRGCGKTTLLKMLTPRALSLWNSNDAKKYTKKISFNSIYIPADSQWSRQIKILENIFPTNDVFLKKIFQAVVTINVLNSVIVTLQDILEIKIDDIKIRFKKEELICCELIDSWNIEKPVSPTFYGILKKLHSRVSYINNRISRIEYSKEIPQEQDLPDYFFNDYLTLTLSAINTFEEICKDQGSNFVYKKWALCFDELEIIPSWLQEEIITYHLRSTNQKFIFKITSSPIVYWSKKIEGSHHKATDGNDYSIVRSWVYNKESSKNWNLFCQKYITQRLEKIGDNLNYKRVFGMNDLNTALIESEPIFRQRIGDVKRDYELNTVMWEVTRSLAEKDKSLEMILHSRGIDPKNPVPPARSGIRDSFFRKVKPILVYRYYFSRRNINDNVELRSRKNVTLYHGFDYISTLAEGNPRILKRITEDLLKTLEKNIKTTPMIPITIQGKIINEFSENYFESLIGHPEGYIDDKINLKNLSSTIGSYFYRKFIRDDFRIDQENCFTIDAKISDSFLTLLRLAIDIGAIQLQDPKNDLYDSSIYGREFKLAYSLFPKFSLPQQKYKSTVLSKVLSSSNTRQLIDIKQQLIDFDEN